MEKPRVVVAGALPAAGLALLGERFAVDQADDGGDPASLASRVPGAAGIVVHPPTPVDRSLLDAAGESLAVVANFGVGIDNIDLDAVRARGVRATNTPGVLSDSTAELAVTLMLAAARRVAEGDAIVRSGRWPDGEFFGRGLVGATVGIVGFGRNGQRVAELLRGFDVRVLYTNRGERPGTAAERRELPELLATADFVTLHLPLTPETRHVIDADTLGLMKPGAILVNASRGALVDTNALIEALRSRHLAGAGLDVFEEEPHVPSQLRALPNTVLLPHVGSATADTRDAMARLAAENVIAVIDGREPPTPVV